MFIVSRATRRILSSRCMSGTTVTAAMVKELREKSNAPMMDCKKALTEVDGDITKAMDWLRAKGIAKSNQTDRSATEGLIGICYKNGKMSLVEVNSETDFVARNLDFQSFVAMVASTVHSKGAVGELQVEDILSMKPETTEFKSNLVNITPSSTIKDILGDITSSIREHIVVRRASVLDSTITTGSTSSDVEVILAGYVHGQVDAGNHLPPDVQMGKAAGVVSLCVTPPLLPASATTIDSVKSVLHTAGRKVAMHIVASRPAYLAVKDVPPSEIERETAII
eukprot:gene8792-18186_t